MGIEMLWSLLVADSLLIAIILLFIFIFTIPAITVTIIRDNKLKRSGILEVDEMTGVKFEEYLQLLLKSKGYIAKITRASGDYGADLVLKKDGIKIIVQVKRYKKNVGIRAVQEIASARKHYKADECWVITNSYFTEQAKRLALSNDVRLINRDELMNWMLEVSESA